MKLYRARLISDRPVRHPAFLGNAPEFRVRGRWFTSCLFAARRHGESRFGKQDWEVVTLEIDDAVAADFLVANAPTTRDGLSPIDFAQDPASEYVLPTWMARDARIAAIGTDGQARVRDYLFDAKPALKLAA